jgi:hypothetical protein
LGGGRRNKQRGGGGASRHARQTIVEDPRVERRDHIVVWLGPAALAVARAQHAVAEQGRDGVRNVDVGEVERCAARWEWDAQVGQPPPGVECLPNDSEPQEGLSGQKKFDGAGEVIDPLGEGGEGVLFPRAPLDGES